VERLRFFISHSAKCDVAKSVLTEICASLRAGGHNVFVDADILAGQEWRSILYHELAMCQAAVVLLDRRSLRARWVQREVDVLMWRHAFDRRLVIVPVLLDDTSAEDIQNAKFGEFPDHNFVRAAGRSAHEVAAQVAGSFADAGDPPDTPMRQWFDDITDVLSLIGHRDRMRQAALQLGVSPQDADQVTLHGGLRFLAHQFIGRAANEATVQAVRKLLYVSDRDTLERLLELIAPAWVDQSAALPLITCRPSDRFVAILNARDPQTAKDYVRRATCLEAPERIETVTPALGERGVDELFTKCEAAVLLLLGGAPHLFPWEALDEDLVRDGPAPAAHLIIDTREIRPHVIAEVVQRLRDRFRWLMIILLTGQDPPSADTVARWRLADARVLEPVLGPGEELQAFRTGRDLQAMVRKGHQ
jgi:hypothetical protein